MQKQENKQNNEVFSADRDYNISVLHSQAALQGNAGHVARLFGTACGLAPPQRDAVQSADSGENSMIFKPNLAVLPPSQLRLWPELDATPAHFTLYGGTALALRLGHRTSVDFDFFSNQSLDPGQLVRRVPYLKDAESLQVAPDILKSRIERDGPLLVSFFGGPRLGQVAPRERAEDRTIHVASLLDLAGTKVAVVQQRAESKDYVDIDILLQNGIDLPTALAAGRIVYGLAFNPVITLKALSFFDDVPTLPEAVRQRLLAAVEAVDLMNLPTLAPCVARTDKSGYAP